MMAANETEKLQLQLEAEKTMADTDADAGAEDAGPILQDRNGKGTLLYANFALASHLLTDHSYSILIQEKNISWCSQIDPHEANTSRPRGLCDSASWRSLSLSLSLSCRRGEFMQPRLFLFC